MLEIINKIELYNKEPINHNYFLIKNYIIFFMIITLNLKNFTYFIKNIFIGKKQFYESVITSIETIKEKKKRRELLSILNYLFLEEYKDLYFRKNEEEQDENLENIFIEKQIFFSSMNIDISAYDNESYKKIIDTLLKFDLNYDNFYQVKKDIQFEDINEYKLHIAQSIIRVAFSKEKANYTNEIYYEYNFIKRVIEKDVEETFKKYQNNYKTLLRKEDLCDDIIKFMFYIFGNSMMIESFIKPVKKLLKNAGLDENCQNITETDNNKRISVDEFNCFFNEMINRLSETIPHVLRILLKLFHVSIIKYFSVNENDYNALYTALFFNFILNPKIQILYSILPHKSGYIKFLNKIIWRNIYNKKYNEGEVKILKQFDNTIEINNKKVTDFIEEKILSINENDEEVKKSLNDLFTEKYLIYPKFLFYDDSKLLCDTVQGGEDAIINFHEIKLFNK